MSVQSVQVCGEKRRGSGIYECKVAVVDSRVQESDTDVIIRQSRLVSLHVKNNLL